MTADATDHNQPAQVLAEAGLRVTVYLTAERAAFVREVQLRHAIRTPGQVVLFALDAAREQHRARLRDSLPGEAAAAPPAPDEPQDGA